MTDLISRPILRVEPTSEPSTGTVSLSAAVAAAGAAAVGVVVFIAVTVIAWFAADATSFGGSIRVGALGWLLANGGGLHLSSATITAAPLGLGVLAAWMLHRGGRWAGSRSTVRSLTDVVAGAAVMGGVYCASAVAVYAVTRTDAAHADLLRTAVATAALGLVFGGWGVLRGAGMTGRLLDALPVEGRAALAGSAAGVAVMVGAGGVLVAVSLAQHFSIAMTLSEGLQAGAVGSAVVALVGIAALPNAVLCAGAFAAGPGFALGTGTSVAPGGVTLGALPSFPLLAAVPHHAVGWWLEALLFVPVAAGAVAGLTAVRRHPVTGVGAAAARGGLAGLAFGSAFGALTWLATGAVGPGRMQDIGPDVAGTLAICVAAGILGGAVAATTRQLAMGALARRRSSARANVTETGTRRIGLKLWRRSSS